MVDALASQELALLVEGLAAGRRRWESVSLARADLSGLDLSGCALDGAILRGAVLRGARLEGASLRDADLRGADLRGASLVGADLRGAQLGRADLRGADLTNGEFHGADARDADLRGATLEGASVALACRSFHGVRVDGATVRDFLNLIMIARIDDPELRGLLRTLRRQAALPAMLTYPTLQEDEDG